MIVLDGPSVGCSCVVKRERGSESHSDVVFWMTFLGKGTKQQ